MYWPATRGATWHFRFGGAHPAGFPMAFCDASVHLLSYDIEDNVWVKYGGRNDKGR